MPRYPAPFDCPSGHELMPNYPTAHETVIYARVDDGWRFVLTTDPYYAATLTDLRDFRFDIEEIDCLDIVCGETVMVEIRGDDGEALASEQITVRYVSELEDVDIKSIPADTGDWECVCGNTAPSDGFQPCDHRGREIEDPGPDNWDGVCVVCARCGLVMDQRTADSSSVAVIGRSRFTAI